MKSIRRILTSSMPKVIITLTPQRRFVHIIVKMQKNRSDTHSTIFVESISGVVPKFCVSPMEFSMKNFRRFDVARHNTPQSITTSFRLILSLKAVRAYKSEKSMHNGVVS